MLLNANAIRMSNFSTVEGQLFEKKSYIVDDIKQQSIPILLGSDYRGVYAIGDEIVGVHLSCEMVYEVIGILQPNCGVYRQGIFQPLDNYLILPALNFINQPCNKNELFLQGATYLQKVNGEVVLNSNYSKEEFGQALQKMIDEYDLFGYDYRQVIYHDVGEAEW